MSFVGSGAMEAWSMTRCLCVALALALVCLTSLWAPAVAQTDTNDGKHLEKSEKSEKSLPRVLLKWFGADYGACVSAVLALQQLQQAWGSAVTWTGSDPCGSQWDGIMCVGNRVTSLYAPFPDSLTHSRFSNSGFFVQTLRVFFLVQGFDKQGSEWLHSISHWRSFSSGDSVSGSCLWFFWRACWSCHS